MRWGFSLLVALILTVAACGGGGDSGGGSDEGSVDDGGVSSGGNESSGGGDVVNAPPPGQATASVDGREYSFDTPGGRACEVSNDEFGFSYIIGDNEVNFGGGASIQGGDWFGTLTLRIFEDNVVTEYSAKLIDNPAAIAISGNSVSYSGPMEIRSTMANGSLSDPEDVGNGTFSSTCG